MEQGFSFQWHITDKCDQRCKHCYIYGEDSSVPINEMSLDQIKITLDNCFEFCNRFNRIPSFAITGGDPLLHPNFWDLVELLRQTETNFIILGNPYHLDEKTCKKLKEYGCTRYQLSIDGMRETHDWFRKKGSFDITLEKIKCIKNAGIVAAIMTTVSEKNIKEVPDIIDTVVKEKADLYTFARYCATSLEKSNNIKPLEYRELLDKCYKKYQKYRNSGTLFKLKDHLWTLYLYETGKFKIPENIDKGIIYDGCNCGHRHLTICADGSILACRRFDSIVGNVYKDKISDVWLNQMEEYREYDKFEKCSKCELFQFCRGCPSVAYGNTHNFYAEDPQCWKIIN